MQSEKDNRLDQSKNISTVGCFGIVLVLLLLILIGGAATRVSINNKLAKVNGILQRMQEQIDKAPGILTRITNYGCGGEYIGNLDELFASNAGASGLNFVILEEKMGRIGQMYAQVSGDCMEYRSEDAFRDLTIQFEGIQNRYAVESGYYSEAATDYNSAISSFPGSFFAWGYNPL